MSHGILAHHLFFHESVEPFFLRVLGGLAGGGAFLPDGLPEELVGVLFDGDAGFEVGEFVLGGVEAVGQLLEGHEGTRGQAGAAVRFAFEPHTSKTAICYNFKLLLLKIIFFHSSIILKHHISCLVSGFIISIPLKFWM